MKIVLVTHSFFPYSIGGREKYVYDLAKGLSKAGHEVEVFTCGDSLFKRYYKIEDSGFIVHYFPRFLIPLLVGYYRIPFTIFSRLLKTDADIIHAHDFHHFTSLICAVVSKKLKKPFLLTEHGYPEQFGIINSAIKFYDKFFLPQIVKSSNKIIAVSNFIKEKLIWKYHVPKRKIQVVHNAIDLSEYKVESNIFREKYGLKNKKIILAVGRLTKEKGFQYLIKAFPNILKNVPESVLVIIGPKNYYEKKLKELTRLNKVVDKVIFTGVVSEEMLKSALFSSNLVIIPSLYEPFGIIALESMAYGKPIIASGVGGLSEFLINYENCLLVSPDSTKELSEKVLELLTNKKLANRLGRNAKKTVKKYDWKNMIDKMLDIYKNELR